MTKSCYNQYFLEISNFLEMNNLQSLQQALNPNLEEEKAPDLHQQHNINQHPNQVSL